jgi:DNA-binding transcriptional MocR family regulator
MDGMELDTAVKLNIYQTLADTAQAPSAAEVARALGASVEEVEVALQRLHKKRLLVPEPGDPSRIRMAPPFSGVETPFRVKIRDKIYYANCVWDALGVPAALREDAVVEASDGHTGEPMTLEVRSGKPVPQKCAIHFAVPAARWWDDIVYT